MQQCLAAELFLQRMEGVLLEVDPQVFRGLVRKISSLYNAAESSDLQRSPASIIMKDVGWTRTDLLALRPLARAGPEGAVVNEGSVEGVEALTGPASAQDPVEGEFWWVKVIQQRKKLDPWQEPCLVVAVEGPGKFLVRLAHLGQVTSRARSHLLSKMEGPPPGWFNYASAGLNDAGTSVEAPAAAALPTNGSHDLGEVMRAGASRSTLGGPHDEETTTAAPNRPDRGVLRVRGQPDVLRFFGRERSSKRRLKRSSRLEGFEA